MLCFGVEGIRVGRGVGEGRLRILEVEGLQKVPFPFFFFDSQELYPNKTRL